MAENNNQSKVCPLLTMNREPLEKCLGEGCGLWTKNQCGLTRLAWSISGISFLVKPLQPIIAQAVKEFIEKHRDEEGMNQDSDVPF